MRLSTMAQFSRREEELLADWKNVFVKLRDKFDN